MELPEPTGFPLQLPAYQAQLVAEFKLPDVILNRETSPLQIVVGEALNVGVVGFGFTVMVMEPQFPAPH